MRGILKKKYLLISIIIVLFSCIFILVNKKSLKDINTKESEISILLKTEPYEYLNPAAKEYITAVYQSSGRIVLTEKNKKEGIPYLNPLYVSYLAMSEEQKEKMEVIPDVYITDYIADVEKEYGALPTSYNLGNVNGKNYLSPVKDQSPFGICWAFATVQNAETLALLKQGKVYSGIADQLSVRHLDYVNSTDGFHYLNAAGNKVAYDNKENGTRKLTGGGNFFMAMLSMGNGLGFSTETNFGWNTQTTTKIPSTLLNYGKIKYEVDEAVVFPSLPSGATATTVTSLTNAIKSLMMTHGGPYVGAFSPQSACGFDYGNKHFIHVDAACDSVATEAEDIHAMQIVGWDDNVSYSYCGSPVHTTGNCYSGRGAWIVRNSWGSSYPTVYLTYNSIDLSIGFITEMNDMSARTWQNNYHNNPWDGTVETVSSDSATFSKKAIGNEKLQKVKFVTLDFKSTYKLSITVGSKTYTDVATMSTTTAGLHTFDISSKNIVIDQNFTVKIAGVDPNSSYILKRSISAFTSNVTTGKAIDVTYSDKAISTSSAPSSSNPVKLADSNNVYILKMKTREIPAGSTISLKYLEGTTDATATVMSGGKFNYYVLDGSVYGEVKINSSTAICGKTYTVQVIYNGTAYDSFVLKRPCNGKATTSNITFNANDGSGAKEVLTVNDGTSTLNGSLSETFKNKLLDKDKYIMYWNTKADGSGTSYNAGPINDINLGTKAINSDMNLYAVWIQAGHQYILKYTCATNYNCSGSTAEQTVKYGTGVSLRKNGFTRTGYGFLYWKYGNNTYYPGETYPSSVIVSPYNNTPLYMESVWSNSYAVVTFNSNTGTGTMSSINVTKSVSSRTPLNKFTKDGNTFKNWNTQADGSGTSYANGAYIKVSADTTLYAQWEAAPLTITFNPNGGSGSATTQTFYYGISQALNANTYTKNGYAFKSWNTKAEGTGTNYSNGQSISVKKDTTLYATWTPNKYYIVFDGNGNTSGSMARKTCNYDKDCILSSNSFYKKGYDFIGWNTNADGTGTTYVDKATIKNLTSTNEASITLYAQWGTAYDLKVSHYVLNKDKKYVDKIDFETTKDKFMSYVTTSYDVTIPLNGKDYIYTGSKTQLYRQGNLIEEYTNIVRGDPNGDGRATALDYVMIKNHIMGTNVITDEVYKTAADANKDGKISALDYVSIKNTIMRRK